MLVSSYSWIFLLWASMTSPHPTNPRPVLLSLLLSDSSFSRALSLTSHFKPSVPWSPYLALCSVHEKGPRWPHHSPSLHCHPYAKCSPTYSSNWKLFIALYIQKSPWYSHFKVSSILPVTPAHSQIYYLESSYHSVCISVWNFFIHLITQSRAIDASLTYSFSFSASPSNQCTDSITSRTLKTMPSYLY